MSIHDAWRGMAMALVPAHVLLQKVPALFATREELDVVRGVCREWRAEYARLRSEQVVKALLREWPQLLDMGFEEKEMVMIDESIVREWRDNLRPWKRVEPFQGCWEFPDMWVGHAYDPVGLVHELATHNFDAKENNDKHFGVFTVRNMAGWVHDLICIHQGGLAYPPALLDSLRSGHVYDVDLATTGGLEMLVDSLKWLLNVNGAIDELFGKGTMHIESVDDFYTKPAVFVWWMVFVHFLSAVAYAPFSWLFDSLQHDSCKLLQVSIRKIEALDGNLDEARDFPPYPEDVPWAHDVMTLCEIVPVLLDTLRRKKRERKAVENMCGLNMFSE